MQSVNLFVGDILPDIDHLQTRRAKETLINILLRGDDRLDDATNRAIFDCPKVHHVNKEDDKVSSILSNQFIG